MNQIVKNVGTDKIKMHEELCMKLHDIYVAKNSDYGDSFGKSYDKYGIIAAMVRMEDKWNRMENLVVKDTIPLVNDESLKDTCLDLANYAIMTYMEISIREQQLKACQVSTIPSIRVDETVDSMEKTEILNYGESKG